MDKDLEIDKLKMRFSRLEESLARALERIALLERRAQQSAPRLEVVTRGELESDEDEDTSPQNVVLALSLEVLELSPEAVVWLTSHQIVTVKGMCEATEARLALIGIQQQHLEEIRGILGMFGLRFGMTFAEQQ